MNFNPESFLLRERAECAFCNLRLSAEVKKILLINEIDKTLTVYADMNMVLSIIQNIVSNAIKFTPLEGTIKIMSKKENNHVLVSVEDDGIGMTPAQQKMIFKKGSNHSTPGTNRESGSGLGLLLCKELVEIHGGKIWSESQEGKGSTFYFTIPDKISN
jgi:signal transduction histidine kinase